MTIPVEPIGSIPRPLELIEAVAASGDGADPKLDALCEDAIRDTIQCFDATGSPVITNGETAFAKIRSRVLGTALAAEILDQR